MAISSCISNSESTFDVCSYASDYERASILVLFILFVISTVFVFCYIHSYPSLPLHQGLMNVLRDEFPQAKHIGCLFHFKQALRRKLLELGVPRVTLCTF